MKNQNQEIVKKFFEAYSKHDLKAVREVMAEDVTWFFMGQHPFSGVKNGIEEVVAFFDEMGTFMSQATMQMEKLIEAENENYFIECQHSKAERADGNDLDHFTCVLWTIKDGKIKEGRHFFADPQSVDKYFTLLGTKNKHISII